MADIEAASVTLVSGTESFPGTAGLRPLLTKYTYPSSCVRRWYQPYPDSSSWYTSLYSTYGRGNYFASCQPSDGTSSLQLRYSPGVCPSGQTIAIITESRTVPVAEDGSGRVWLAYCCLSGFKYHTGTVCYSSAASELATAYRAATTTYTTTIAGTASVRIRTDDDASSNSTSLLYASFIVDPIGVFWKASDLPNFEPAYASALASKLKIEFTANPTQNRPCITATVSPGSVPGLPQCTSPATSPALSTGAKAGIGVGAVLGALALAAVVFVFFLWRKRRRRQVDTTHEYEVAPNDAPELVQYHDPTQAPQVAHYPHPYPQHAELNGTSHAPYNTGPMPISMPPRELA